MYGCLLICLDCVSTAVELSGLSICPTLLFRLEVCHHYCVQLGTVRDNVKYCLSVELVEQFVCKSPGTYFIYREVGDIVEEFLPSFGGLNEVIGVCGNLCWRSCSPQLTAGRCKCNI